MRSSNREALASAQIQFLKHVRYISLQIRMNEMDRYGREWTGMDLMRQLHKRQGFILKMPNSGAANAAIAGSPRRKPGAKH